MKPTPPASRRPQADPDALHNVAATETVHHVRSAMRRKPPNRIGELNLTSMLDITFLLLIFFVLTASFAVGEGLLPADLPAGQSAASPDDPEPPQQPIRITLRSLGGDDVSIQVPGLPTPPAGFTELYHDLRGLRHDPRTNPTGPYSPDDPIIIQPDGTVGWGHVVSAFNAAVRAEFTNVNFAQPNE